MEIEDINKNILKKMWDFYIDKKVFVKGKQFKYNEVLYIQLSKDYKDRSEMYFVRRILVLKENY